MKTIMVTGSQGFLGKSLVKELLSRTEELEIKQVIGVNNKNGKSLSELDGEIYEEAYCCLENEPWIRCLFEKIQPDIIFHMAARQGKDLYSFQNNVNSTLYLAEYCPKDCRFVYASSSTVYGDLSKKNFDCDTQTDEDEERETYSCRETDQTSPTSLYGSGKLAGESILLAYQKSNKLHPLILRYCAIIGTGSSHGVLPDIIRKLKDPSIEKLELWGNRPGSIKPYIHVEDAVGAILSLAFKKYNDPRVISYTHNGIYNICPNDNINIDVMAELIMNEVGIHKIKNFLGYSTVPTGDNRIVKMSNKKIMDIYQGWRPKFTTSAESIIQTVEDING